MHHTSEFNSNLSVCVTNNQDVVVMKMKRLWHMEIMVPDPDEDTNAACIRAHVHMHESALKESVFKGLKIWSP